MRTLVVGGDGMIGHALVEGLRRREHEVLYTSRRDPEGRVGAVYLDLLDPQLPEVFMDGADPLTQPVMYLVAAVTGIMRCETDSETWRVNADAPAALARQAARTRGWSTVFVSSDAVERAPQLKYALQKAYAETAVLGYGGCVVRPGRVAPERVDDLVTTLVGVGEDFRPGLVRWS